MFIPDLPVNRFAEIYKKIVKYIKALLRIETYVVCSISTKYTDCDMNAIYYRVYTFYAMCSIAVLLIKYIVPTNQR